MKKSISKTVDVLIPLLAIIVGGLLYAIEYTQVSNLTTDTLMANGEFGPGPLPSWADDADVKLGWDFIDPFNPESANPLLGWDIAIGDTPLWSYDANRELGADPAQWYIQIDNLYENIQYKHFWLCWNYEWDAYGVGVRSATNLYWYPDSDYQNFQYQEQLYDAYGNPTTNHELGVLAQGIMSVDILSNPEYEEIYLGLFNGNKKVLEVYIMAQCVERPIIEPEVIGPGTLPDWHLDAQVQLGWIFDDPTNPQDTDLLPEWSKSIGDIPEWSYDANREYDGALAQWHIRIPNLINNQTSKKVWISLVYEYDSSITEPHYAINIEWNPNYGMDNPMAVEELFDSEGNPTTNTSEAVYGRVTGGLDLYPNPEYEDIWLGIYGDSKNALEVYLKTWCTDEPVEPVIIGPGTLPDWHLDAQVQLGWIFDDPTNPQDTDLLPEWSQSIGDIPEWSYDANREYNGAPAQWYIRIPNLINNQTSKKVWISWVYEYDSSIAETQYATNIEWYPNTGMDNPMGMDELFDSEGNPTTDTSEAVYGRVTGALDLYPNPEYEDVWLGLLGENKNVLEVYIKTLCIEEIEPEPETEIDISIDTWLSFIANENTELKQVIKVISSSTEIKLVIDIKQEGNGIPGCDLRISISGSVANTDISINIDQYDGTTSVKVSLDVTLVGILNNIAVSVDISQSGSFTDFVLDTDINIGT
ncbi:MAG: hypothetical protein ACFFAV_03535 [Candidatus Hermodarchaeota archaeon]